MNRSTAAIALLLGILVAQTTPVQSRPSDEAAADAEIRNELAKGPDRSEHWTKATDVYSLAASEGAQWSPGKGSHLELKSGNFVIEASKATEVDTPTSHISLRPRSVTVVQITPTGERVFAVLETLKLIVHKHFTSLRFGEEAYVCDHDPNHDELIGDSQIGLRQLRVQHVANMSVAIMEFSLLQLAEREDILSNIIHSAHDHDRAIKQRLLKSAAVLNMVTARHGNYAGPQYK